MRGNANFSYGYGLLLQHPPQGGPADFQALGSFCVIAAAVFQDLSGDSVGDLIQGAGKIDGGIAVFVGAGADGN